MFEKLVVSTRERRGARTAKFVLGTSLIYAFSAACAVALSVVVANPRLADINLGQTEGIVLPIRQPQQNEAPPTASRAQAAARDDGSNPTALADLLRQPQDASPRAPINSPPVLGPIEGPAGGIGYYIPGAVGQYGAPGTGEGRNDDIYKTIGVPPAPPRPAPDPQPTEAAKKPVRLTSSVLQGKAIERPSPAYPPLARAAGVEGPAAIEIIIAPDGRVESARAVNGHALLAAAARDAARRWRFEPTLLNGTAVRVTGIITFVFRLRE
jgi:TonB family protein